MTENTTIFDVLYYLQSFNKLHARDVKRIGKEYNANVFVFCRKWGICYSVEGWKLNEDGISWEPKKNE